MDHHYDVDMQLEGVRLALWLGALETADAIDNLTWTNPVSGLWLARTRGFQVSAMYFARKPCPDIPAGWHWDVQDAGRTVALDYGIATLVAARTLAAAALRTYYYR